MAAALAFLTPALAACSEEPPRATRQPLAAGPAGVPGPLPATYLDLAAGARLYQEHCASCHGAAGQGDGAAGRLLSPAPTDFTAPAFALEASPQSAFQAISHGRPGTAMLRWDGVLDEAARWDLALYVWRVGAPSSSGPAEARELAAPCLACHSAGSAPRLDSAERTALSRQAAAFALASAHPDAAASANWAELLMLLLAQEP